MKSIGDGARYLYLLFHPLFLRQLLTLHYHNSPAIELKSSSNLWRCGKSSSLYWKNLETVGFCVGAVIQGLSHTGVCVGAVIQGLSLPIFGWGHRSLGANAKSEFFTHIDVGN